MLLTGCICAIIGGVSQPVLALIAGRITNVLLVYPPNSPEFRKKGYECVYIFLGIFIFVMGTNFIQVPLILTRISGFSTCVFIKSAPGSLPKPGINMSGQF